MSCTEIIKSFLHYILRLVFQILLYIINADEPLLCMVCIVYLEVAQIPEDNFTDISTIVQYKSHVCTEVANYSCAHEIVTLVIIPRVANQRKLNNQNNNGSSA